MRKLLRHLVYLPIWIALVRIGWEIIWRNLPGPMGHWVVPPTPEMRLAALRELEELRRAVIASHSPSIGDYAWLLAPLAVVIVIWAAIQLVHRKRPRFDSEGGGVA